MFYSQKGFAFLWVEMQNELETYSMNSINGCEIWRYNQILKCLTDIFCFYFSLIHLYYHKNAFPVVHNEKIWILPYLMWTDNDLHW